MDSKDLLIVIGSLCLMKVLFLAWIQLVLSFHGDPDLNPKRRIRKSKRKRLAENLDDMFQKSVLDEYGKERFKSVKRHLKRERERISQWQKLMRLQKNKSNV